MARVHAPLYAFNQGEVSRLALGRVDVEKLRLAAQVQVNWTPWVLGPMMLRPGLIRIGEILEDKPANLLRFVFSRLDVALLELTDGVMRVWVGEELVTRPAVATTISDPTFQTGSGWVTTGTTAGATATAGTGRGVLSAVPVGGLARLQQTVSVASGDHNTLHALRISLSRGPVTVRVGTSAGLSDLVAQTDLDAGDHSLAFTPGAASFVLQIESVDARDKHIDQVTIESAGALTLPTAWTAGDLENVRYDQSGDVVFVACYGLPQYKIERRSSDSWSVARYFANDGPFGVSPPIDANLSFSSYSLNGTVTSDRPFFTADLVGTVFRAFTSGQLYSTVLGAANAYTPAVRVTGVGTGRNFSFGASGTYSGVLTWQRSFDGPDSGFVDVSSAASGATGTIFSSSTGGSSGTPDLDNIDCWERVGFKAGSYTSGAVTVVSTCSASGGFGIIRITDDVAPTPTSATYEVLQQLSNVTATKDWVQGGWGQESGYPTSVCLFDGRLFWFGQDRFWGSGSDNFTSYADQDRDGSALGDAGALNEQFGSGPVDTVSWGVGVTRLLAGREGSISSIRASAFDEVLTPTNISAKDCSTQGTTRLPAVKLDTSVVYVSGRRVYKLVFNPQALDYQALDLTRLNLDIGKPGFVWLDGQRQPDTNIYFVRSEGQVAVCLEDPQDEVRCWWRMQTAGVFENVAVLPDAGIEDLVYFVVKRTINGVTRRFIERLAHRDSATGGLLNVQLDCCLSYSGDPVSTVQLPWLPSTVVKVWADGVSLGSTTTDATGNCAIPDALAHSDIVVGIGGDVITGSTQTTLPDDSAPNVIFSGNSNTLTVPSRYEGCPAEVFADLAGNGKPIHVGTLTVTGGVITLPNNRTASVITACLGYVAPFMSAKLAYGAQLGSALGQKKRLEGVGLVLIDTARQGLRMGQRFDQLSGLPSVESGQEVDEDLVYPEYDEPMVRVPGNWSTDARLCLLAQAPFPCTVAGAVIGIDTREKS